MRSKEEAHDYRYFPEPDLPPLVLAAAWIEHQRTALPELPAARRARLEREHDISAYHASVVTGEPALADYFERLVAAGVEGRTAANWVTADVMTAWNETGGFPVSAARLAELIGLEREGTVSLQAAKRVFGELREGDAPARTVAERLGVIQVRDEGALAGWVDEVIAAHPDEVRRYRAGEGKLMGFFVGQVMKRSRGTAYPMGVQRLLTAKLG
jgi:aspartyl-tRNA(Asn)/glutamyl-tRNA(Gln) amidotransferase subunit B